MPRVTLTPRKQQVYKFILAYKSQHDGNSPSLHEIGKGCGLRSMGYISEALHGLESLGLIRLNYVDGKARAIEVIGGKWTPPKKQEFTEADARKSLPVVTKNGRLVAN